MFDQAYQARNFLAARPEWLALHVEAPIWPDLPIVDAHHHIWDLPHSRYLADDFRTDLLAGHTIEQTVYVDCKSMYRTEGEEELRSVGEVDYMATQVPAFRTADGRTVTPCAGIVGWADLRLGDRVVPVLEALVAAGRGRTRGVRARAAWHEDPILHPHTADGPPEGLLLDPAFQRGVQCLTAMQLTLDVWVFHTQLGDVYALAKSCPDTTIILNHLGGPLGIGPFADRREAVFADWSAALRRLAVCQNVVVKLGGLAMPRIGFAYDRRSTPPSSIELAAAWQPYIATALDLFGAERCMFESNFPVDKGMCSYGVLWNAFKRMTADCGREEREALFSGTARRVYRLNA